MADIFISYARADKARVTPLVAALKAQGWSVWWDPAIVPGEEFDFLIRKEIKAASAVIVVWTPASVDSRWVRGEARLGAERGILVPVRFERAELPIDAMAIHTTDLDDWKEDTRSSAFKELLGALSRHLKDVPRSTQGEQRTSICVLPFANMSADAEQEYFSDGITEDIITDLSKVSSLSVIARNTAFTFKGKHVDIPQVAKQLKVNHVLEGSVRKSGNRVRITGQLIDGVNGNHLWAERYDRNLDDIFALQDEISQAIVKALKLKLFPEEERAIEERGTNNVEAYDLFLRARALNSSLTGPEVRRSLDIYRRALALDPNFAQAWAGLASALGGSFIYFPETIAAGRAEMDDALAHAAALAPDLLELHASQILPCIMRHDWINAERHFASIVANTNSIAPGISGYLLLTLGRAVEGVEHRLRERSLDPLSLGTSFGLQLAFDIAGRYAEAEAEYERSKDLPGNRSSLEWRAATRMWAMKNDAAFKERFEFYVGDPSFMSFSPQIAKVLDEPQKVLAIIRAAFSEAFYQDGSRMGMLANWAAHYGDNDLALKALRRGYVDMHGLTLVEIWHPVFVEVRKDARFKEIVRDLGLFDYWCKSGHWGDFARPLGADDFEIIK